MLKQKKVGYRYRDKVMQRVARFNTSDLSRDPDGSNRDRTINRTSANIEVEV